MTGFLEITIRALKSYTAHQCGLLAAGITYFSLVALVPMLIFAISVTGFFVDEADQRRIVDQFMQVLPLSEDAGRANVEDLVSGAVAARAALGVVGLLGTVYAATALSGAIRASLAAVYRQEKQRRFFHGKAVDVGLLLGFTALLVLSAGLTLAIALAQRYSADVFGERFATGTAWLLTLAYPTVPALLSLPVFYLLYTAVAAAGLRRSDAAVGALVAAVGFEVLKVGFAQYVAYFGRYDATYGTVGFVVALLAFLNLSAKVMLVGAEVAGARRLVERDPPGERRREVTALREKLGGWRRRAGRRQGPTIRPPSDPGAPPVEGRAGSFAAGMSPLFAEAAGTAGTDNADGPAPAGGAGVRPLAGGEVRRHHLPGCAIAGLAGVFARGSRRRR